MRRLIVLASLVALAVPTGASAQTAAPPDRPVALAPGDGYTKPLPGKITFRVRGMPNEPAGSLGIELNTEDAEPNATMGNEGRYDDESPYHAGAYTLVETESGSGIYEVTVEFEGDRSFPSDRGYYWHAFRQLTAGQNCTPRTDGTYDCFQETEERSFTVEDPESHGANEPKNNRPAGATFNDGLTTDGWLEAAKDRDWYRFKSGRGTRLNVLIGNDHRGRVPSGQNGDILFAVYRASRMGRPIVKRRLAPGERNGILRARIKPHTRYRLVVRHAGSDKPAMRDIAYSFYIEKGVAG
jgi:hypothetical protein